MDFETIACGRSKYVVSRGGNKIAPLETENLFAQQEGVVASALPAGRTGKADRAAARSSLAKSGA